MEKKDLNVKDLTERSILVCLEIDGMNGWRRDVSETAALEQKTGASKGRVTASKRILKEELTVINTIDAKIRSFYQANTRPWDKGWAIIPIATPSEEAAAAAGEPVEINFVRFEKGIRALIDERNTAVQNFLDGYVEAIEEDRKRLNGAFKESDYPPVEKLRKKYRVVYQVSPVPKSDFRVVSVSDSLLKDLQNRVAEQERERLAEVGTSIVQEAVELVKPFLEKLESADPKFSTPTLDRVQRILDSIKRLDITCNPELETLFNRMMETVGKYSADVLNVNSFARKAIKTELEAAMENMAGYL